MIEEDYRYISCGGDPLTYLKSAFKAMKIELEPGQEGRNGAGKSTTIKVLTTLIGYDSGVAEVLGLDVSRKYTNAQLSKT